MDNILLLGSTGMLGQALYQQLINNGYEVVGVARTGSDYNIDITNDDELEKCIDWVNPNVIINSAATVNLEECEVNEEGVYRINSRLPGVLANKCRKSDSYLIHISTDHYYTGDIDKKHKEEDTVHLINGYARTKFCGEMMALSYENSLVLRTNIVGFLQSDKRKTFIEWAIGEIRQGKEIPLFNDFFTSSMHTRDFALVLCEILERRDLFGIYNIASSEVSSKLNFICKLSNVLFGKMPNYHEASVTSLNGARRAESLGLDTTKIEMKLGHSMPDLAQTMSSIHAEYERRMALCNIIHQLL